MVTCVPRQHLARDRDAVRPQKWVIHKSGHYITFFICKNDLLLALPHTRKPFPTYPMLSPVKTIPTEASSQTSSYSNQGVSQPLATWLLLSGKCRSDSEGLGLILPEEVRWLRNHSQASEKQNKTIFNAAWELTKGLWKWSSSKGTQSPFRMLRQDHWCKERKGATVCWALLPQALCILLSFCSIAALRGRYYCLQ